MEFIKKNVKLGFVFSQILAETSKPGPPIIITVQFLKL